MRVLLHGLQSPKNPYSSSPAPSHFTSQGQLRQLNQAANVSGMEGFDKAEPIQEKGLQAVVIWGHRGSSVSVPQGPRGVQRILDQGCLRIQRVLPGTRAQKTGLDGASDAVSQDSTHPDDRAPHMLHRVSAGQLEKLDRTSP